MKRINQVILNAGSEAMARPTKHGVKLVTYSVKLKPDQVDFLKTLSNAGEMIREALDKDIPDLRAGIKRRDEIRTRISEVTSQIDQIDEESHYPDLISELRDKYNQYGNEELLVLLSPEDISSIEKDVSLTENSLSE